VCTAPLKFLRFHLHHCCRVTSLVGQKNNKLATKVANWLSEHKCPTSSLEAAPSSAGEPCHAALQHPCSCILALPASLAESLRLLIVDIDADVSAAVSRSLRSAESELRTQAFNRWAQGTSNVRGLSTATWAGIYSEAKDFLEQCAA
jgi:hypothetical protein